MTNLSSDQKQKLSILLGFAGCLIILGFVALRPGSSYSISLTAGSIATAQTVGSGRGASTSTAGKPLNPASKKIAAVPQTGATVVRPASGPSIPVPERVPLAPSRPDPFAPVYVPTPPPEQAPTPVPPAVVIPPPPPISLPSRAPVGAPPSTVLVGLPSPRISRYNPLPGPRWVVPVVARGTDTAARSADKRLAGVIIGDSVRALLEIQQGNAGGGGGEGGGDGGGAAQVITRVVQPGDEVDGIKILRINREFENGRPVTRMYVLEGDQERYIDLRAAPTPPTANAGGEGFEGGSSTPSGSGRGGFGRGGSGSAPPGGFGGGSSGGFGRGGGNRPTFP